MSMPNIVMNSLVSPTKVITNDTIPNPIVASHNPITLPSIPLPVPSIGIPIMNLKTDTDDKLDDKANDLEAEAFDTEDDKLSDTKKSDESMPVEDDSIIEMAHKIEENITETDVEVTDVEPIEITTEIIKTDDICAIEQPLNKSDDLSATTDQMSTAEPMECASVNSMASPKHIMTTDIVMAESVSVSSQFGFHPLSHQTVFSLVLHKYWFIHFQTSSTGSMQVESSDTSLTSNTDMHDIVEK